MMMIAHHEGFRIFVKFIIFFPFLFHLISPFFCQLFL